MRRTYGIDIDCANCARKVEEAISEVDGIESVTLSFVDKRMFIEVSDGNVDRFDEIEKAAEETAHRVESDFRMWRTDTVSECDDEKEKDTYLIPRICTGVAFLAFGLLLEYVLDWNIDGTVLRAVFLIGLLVVGYDVVANAVRNLVHARFLDENFLMAVATLGALAIGYWTESVAVMLFYQIGEFFQDRAVDRSREHVKALAELKAPYATVIRNGKTQTVQPESVEVGETVAVGPGEMVPIDGIVTAGEGFVDTKAMTGEPVPRHVGVGDKVLAGYINTSETLMVRTETAYRDSASAKILALIEDSASRKSRSEKFITRFAKVYTPAVVLCALAIAVIPSVADPSGWKDWVYKGLIFLVVSCPCALVVSVPLSYYCGIGRASKDGILVKGSTFIEALSGIDKAVFDKTGTLTKGEFSVNRIEPEGMSETELLDLAACAEAFSDHPISKSIIGRLGHDIDPSRISDSSAIPGKGVEAMVDGRVVTVGNVRMMKECGIDLESEGDRSETNVYVAVDGKYAGRLVISDGLKDDAEDAVSSLKDMGVRTYMLTGDTEPVGKAVAERLRLDGYRAEMLPGDKTSELERIMSSSEGKTCFVGDGINDSPALARADVGIAMGCIGSDSAVEAADVVILDDSPSKVASSIRISKRTQTIVAENIVLALAVKFAILALTAFTDAVDMWIAIFGDVGVLVIAVLNAVRALRIPRGDARNRMSEERCGD
ncbi:heavy metal translocating P-type ATPase [Methanomethylophilus alvi]|uniref:heavy metal translocating P-type ATPase n=1 Tax=Methanomethylophilus alvi TaxID=1291540 RepID=UPI0037DC118D